MTPRREPKTIERQSAAYLRKRGWLVLDPERLSRMVDALAVFLVLHVPENEREGIYSAIAGVMQGAEGVE